MGMAELTAPRACVVEVVPGRAGYTVTPLSSSLVHVRTITADTLASPVRLSITRAADAWVIGAAELVFRSGDSVVVPVDTPRVLSVSQGITEYRITVAPEDQDLSSFSDSTEIVSSVAQVPLVYRAHGLQSHRSGLFTRTLRFAPLNASDRGRVGVT